MTLNLINFNKIVLSTNKFLLQTIFSSELLQYCMLQCKLIGMKGIKMLTTINYMM